MENNEAAIRLDEHRRHCDKPCERCKELEQAASAGTVAGMQLREWLDKYLIEHDHEFYGNISRPALIEALVKMLAVLPPAQPLYTLSEITLALDYARKQGWDWGWARGAALELQLREALTTSPREAGEPHPKSQMHPNYHESDEIDAPIPASDLIQPGLMADIPGNMPGALSELREEAQEALGLLHDRIFADLQAIRRLELKMARPLAPNQKESK